MFTLWSELYSWLVCLLFGAVDVIFGRAPGPIVVRMIDRASAHYAGDRFEGLGEWLYRLISSGARRAFSGKPQRAKGLADAIWIDYAIVGAIYVRNERDRVRSGGPAH